jgi:predicted transposase YdaD
MSQRYDAGTKHLVEDRLADWLALSDLTSAAPAEVINADLATVTAAADRVLLVKDTTPWLLHLELQSSWDDTLCDRLRLYNTLLEYRHQMRVHSMAVLLRPHASSARLTGTGQSAFPGRRPHAVWRFQVVRVWRLPTERLLAGGLGLLPLAPLSQVKRAELPALIQRMDERIRGEATAEEGGVLWTATKVLMGLRFPATFIAQLLRGVHGMKESVTYQEIVGEGIEIGFHKGEVQYAQKTLLRLGRERFGEPTEQIVRAIQSSSDIAQFDKLMGRLLHVSSWQELLSEP